MFNLRNILKHRKLERGQSFIEMSLSFVFFLFFVMGMLDLGRLYFQFVALEDAAGEAALYLALNASCPAAPGHADCALLTTGVCEAECADPNNARARASDASSLIDFTNPNATLTFEFIAKTSTSEDMVKVKLEYPFALLTPVIADLVGADTVKLTAEATQVLIEY